MVALNRLTKKKLGEILTEQGIITEQQVQDALRQQHQKGMLFGEVLIEQGLITEEKIVSVLVEQFGIPYIDALLYDKDESLFEIFDPEKMEFYQFVPLDTIGSVLVIAIGGLLSEELIESMESETGCTIQVYLTKMSHIKQILSSMKQEAVDNG